MSYDHIILPENIAAYRAVPGDRYYGYEFYKFSDPLAEWIAARVELTSCNENTRALIIEIGGASGFKAMDFAQRGYDVAIIDRDDNRQIIAARNNILAQKQGTGRISLHVADIHDVSSKMLEKICDGRTPAAIVSFLCVHFLDNQALGKFFALAASVSTDETLLGLSYHRPTRHSNGDDSIQFRYPVTVEKIAKHSGYSEIKIFPELSQQEGVVRQAFRLKY